MNLETKLSPLAEKRILGGIFALSTVVLLTVVFLYNLPPAETVPAYLHWLPRINAMINATCTLLLITSYLFIRQKKVTVHRTLNMITFCLSSLFLVLYVIFHSYGIETRYPADNPLRPVYFFILITHIIFAATVLPLVLVTFYFALKGQVAKHRKIARWTFPVWLYVTATGVIVYLMISPYYRF